MNIIDARYHRNGVSGEGFCAAIVADPFDEPEMRDQRFLVITLPDAVIVEKDGTERTVSRAEHTFVLAVDDIAAGNLIPGWRGDRAAGVCRQAIIDHVNENIF